MEKLRRDAAPVIHFLRRRGPVWRWLGVDDPRGRRGRRFPLAAMLNATVLAIMAGARSIRTAVGNAERFGSLARRVGAVCRCGRTAIGDLLPRLDPAQLRDALIRFVRGEWYRKTLRPDRLPIGLVAIDGKALWSASKCFHPESQDQSAKGSDKKYPGHRTWVLRVLRAALVSTASCVVIDQQVIPAATNEMGFFGVFFGALMKAYGRLGMIQAVSVDAGMVSRANADTVRKAGLHDIFRLKSPQVELLREATRLLEPLATTTRPEAVTPWESDSARGRVRRQLWRTTEMAGWNDWRHLSQTWLVRTQRRDAGGKALPAEDSYYVTSLGSYRLEPMQILDAVRDHWGVENNAHGTADIVFDEDHSPCSKTGAGIHSASLLRLLAINLCQLYRHRRHGGADRTRTAWQLLLSDIFFALRLPASSLPPAPPPG